MMVIENGSERLLLLGRGSKEGCDQSCFWWLGETLKNKGNSMFIIVIIVYFDQKLTVISRSQKESIKHIQLVNILF